jgi:phosphodiesterase/alkaline phosphatase D-like protein
VFQWGESESYEHETSCTALPGSGNAPVTVHAALAGLAPNTPYHYRLVASNQNGEGTPGADQTFATQPVAPAVTAPAPFASDVSQLAATLNATIDPLGALTSYHFEYGTTTAYGSVVPEPDLYLPIDSSNHQVSQALTGLQAGTIYHFALVANSAGGTQTSPDETFTTPAIPLPVVSAGAASGAKEGAVTLAGAIDPGGWETTYTFQYGTSTAYGQQWPTLPVALGGLSGAQPVTIYLEGLLPATTYHYRLVASDGGGTAYGPDEMFRTAAYPLSVVQEPLVLQPSPGAKGEPSGSGSPGSAGKSKGKGGGKKGRGKPGGKRRRRVSRGKAKRGKKG